MTDMWVLMLPTGSGFRPMAIMTDRAFCEVLLSMFAEIAKIAGDCVLHVPGVAS